MLVCTTLERAECITSEVRGRTESQYERRNQRNQLNKK